MDFRETSKPPDFPRLPLWGSAHGLASQTSAGPQLRGPQAPPRSPVHGAAGGVSRRELPPLWGSPLPFPIIQGPLSSSSATNALRPLFHIFVHFFSARGQFGG